MTRILELSRTPAGNLMAVVEYMGYSRGELLPLEQLIDPANALTDAYTAVQTQEVDAYRTVHYVLTELKHGTTNIPSLLHQGNHTAVISLKALQQRGYCLDSCTVFRLMPKVPFFLPLGLADLMVDCEGKRLDPIPAIVAQATGTRTRRASLKRMIGHLTTVTNGALALPAALAEGTGGERRWQGLDLINGARYSDLKQALEDFNSVYGPQQWRELLQRDVPGLTEGDVEWLSTIKEEVRPASKRKAKGLEPRADNRRRRGDRGASRDARGKQGRGGSEVATSSREMARRGTVDQRQEQPESNPMDVDTISPTGGEEGGEGRLDDTRRDSESEEDDDMSGEAPAPSELARSLGCHRTTLQQVRRKLHGQGNKQGITGKIAALLVWMALQVTHRGDEDPVIFLADLGEGIGEGGSKGRGKNKRKPELSSFQTPRFRQQPLTFGGGGRVRGREGGGGDEEEGSRGQARRRTEQLGSELTPLIPAPGTDRSDGKGAATGLV